MDFDAGFFEEEVRCGYTVTAEIKRVWAVELELLALFDSICKKHGLRYYVDYGTLLGAVRHHGFIPWDNDIDITMFRGEYQKLKAVMQNELEYPFFFQDSYTDPLRIMTLSKLQNLNTAAIEFPEMLGTEFHQGISVDIMPLDDVADGKRCPELITNMELAMWYGIVEPNILQEDKGFSEIRRTLEGYLELSVIERFGVFEEFCASQAGKSDTVNWLSWLFVYHKANRKKTWYEDIVYMPFENMKVPCPAGYDEILKSCYGDYMTPVQGGSQHEGIILDADRPYSSY